MFSQNITKISNSDCNNDDCQKSATCHECGKKGHIRPNLPNIKSNNDDGYESANKEKNKVCEKSARTKENLNKSVQFFHDMDNEASDNDDHLFEIFV